MTPCPFDRFRARFTEVLSGSRTNPVPGAFLDALRTANFTPAADGPPPDDPDIAAQLDQALSALDCDPALAELVAPAARRAVWYRILEHAPVGERLRQGLMVGQIGAAEDPPLRIGFFLLSPDLHYPLHQHEAIEIYAPLSGMLHVQHGLDGTLEEIAPGSWSVTPSNRLHVLETGDTPCLLVYVWTGAITSPGYWWSRDDDGGWQRTRWDRRWDGRWFAAESERVDTAILRLSREI